MKVPDTRNRKTEG